MQICLCDEAFLVAYLPGCIHESTSARVVEIEMVPIYHTSAHIFVVYIFIS